MRDRTGRVLAPEDPVTVSFPSDRSPGLYSGVHGVVESIGTKRVRIRITRGHSEYTDGRSETFLPADLEYGHHGKPRTSDKMADAMVGLRRANVGEATALAVEAGVITQRQAAEVVQLWIEHTEPPKV